MILRDDVVSDLGALPTPALVIDAATAQKNIQTMATYVSANRLALRPHTKTHKNRFIAGLQMEAGAIGLTVAKVGEGIALHESARDLLMAYPAVDKFRCEGLAELAKRNTVRVVVDSLTGVDALKAAAKAAGSTIGIVVEIDVGMGRTGVASPEESLALAQAVSVSKHLQLDGILCYPGHIWDAIDQQATPIAAVSSRLQEALDLWARHGLQAKVVSGGSTPTAFQSHLVKQYTEIRPGTYVFNDMNTVRGGFCTLDQCAARIVCTVVSTAVKDQIVIDGGTKTFTSDLCLPAKESGHGYMVEYPEAKVTRLSEEHGQVDVSQCERRPKTGERVSVIPNHICPCVNLQDSIWWREANGSLHRINVDGRGKLS